ncbi:MAG: inorganic pyrophosphatase [Candidatus Lokiarchaeota archaeon]|nr:inorganic pyrophosphatase [Candidatus Lokiarchaeota archaeon]
MIKMLYWKKITPGPRAPDIVYSIIECPKGAKNKYEISKKINIMVLDRTLHSSVIYPQDYGFIPGTLASDGDPLDVLVIISNPSAPSTLIECRPIGVLIMEDEKGLDEKILAVAINDPHYNEYQDVVQLPKHFLDEIQEFFRTYKSLEETSYADVRTWKGRDAAHVIIEDSIGSFKKKYGDCATVDPKSDQA